MRFIKYQIKDGSIDIKSYIHEAKSNVAIPGWAVAAVELISSDADAVKEVTPKEYLWLFCNGGTVSIDKPAITADGLDTATVTAEVHPDLTEVTFYHADTGEPIATVPVDPATHTVTLQVTATTPGIIRIRAGEPTMTKLNEVVITAQ